MSLFHFWKPVEELKEWRNFGGQEITYLIHTTYKNLAFNQLEKYVAEVVAGEKL